MSTKQNNMYLALHLAFIFTQAVAAFPNVLIRSSKRHQLEENWAINDGSVQQHTVFANYKISHETSSISSEIMFNTNEQMTTESANDSSNSNDTVSVITVESFSMPETVIHNEEGISNEAFSTVNPPLKISTSSLQISSESSMNVVPKVYGRDNMNAHNYIQEIGRSTSSPEESNNGKKQAKVYGRDVAYSKMTDYQIFNEGNRSTTQNSEVAVDVGGQADQYRREVHEQQSQYVTGIEQVNSLPAGITTESTSTSMDPHGTPLNPYASAPDPSTIKESCIPGQPVTIDGTSTTVAQTAMTEDIYDVICRPQTVIGLNPSVVLGTTLPSVPTNTAVYPTEASSNSQPYSPSASSTLATAVLRTETLSTVESQNTVLQSMSTLQFSTPNPSSSMFVSDILTPFTFTQLSTSTPSSSTTITIKPTKTYIPCYPDCPEPVIPLPPTFVHPQPALCADNCNKGPNEEPCDPNCNKPAPTEPCDPNCTTEPIPCNPNCREIDEVLCDPNCSENNQKIACDPNCKGDLKPQPVNIIGTVVPVSCVDCSVQVPCSGPDCSINIPCDPNCAQKPDIIPCNPKCKNDVVTTTSPNTFPCSPNCVETSTLDVEPCIECNVEIPCTGPACNTAVPCDHRCLGNTTLNPGSEYIPLPMVPNKAIVAYPVDTVQLVPTCLDCQVYPQFPQWPLINPTEQPSRISSTEPPSTTPSSILKPNCSSTTDSYPYTPHTSAYKEDAVRVVHTDCNTQDKRDDAAYIHFECDVNNPLACDQKLFEVCNFRNGTYKCECPPNHSRLPDGRCLVVNECFEPALNDCSEDASCTDTLESYICSCKKGFTDLSPDTVNKPGRICKKFVNECQDPSKYGVDCDRNAICQDTNNGYTCVCNSGFFDVSERYNLKTGRKCEQENDPCKGSNDCSKNATCTSNKGIYTCQCKSGFVDVSPDKNYPGRDCRQTTTSTGSCSRSDGHLTKKCPPGDSSCYGHLTETTIQPLGTCTCPAGTVWDTDEKQCIVPDLCRSGKHDCHTNANCISRATGYDCECKAGYTDLTPQPNRGRSCILPESKCDDRSKNKCSPFAKCFPELQGYRCECEAGYLDVSAEESKPRGYVCVREKEECSDGRLNSCDENADCIKKPGGYDCLCQEGYNDVSYQANLQPGRVCTLATNCPNQPTDLIFLVDGSGSIGATVFRNDVLRFVSDFSTLFSIGPDQTRIGVIQFSDLKRKEFDLNQYTNQQSLQNAIRNIQYLMGLTSTGEAINYMIKEGFNEKNGARPAQDSRSPVHRIAVVITDGRSQDNVLQPANAARAAGVKLFAVGVTDAVAESQLIEIAGNKSNVFIVGAFKDLNTKLRARIQKLLCPENPPPGPNVCPGCDPTRNYVCVNKKCVCPPGFCEDPVNKICGAQLCNPQLSFTCPAPMICKQTPYRNHRCACPSDYSCDLGDGSCRGNVTCPANQKYNPTTRACEGCNPPCDASRNFVCQSNPKGDLECNCKPKYTLDPVSQVCTINECAVGIANCSQYANCTDKLLGFICNCWPGYKDNSPGNFPGTVCEKIINPCEGGRHNCSEHAKCIPDMLGGYKCECEKGFIDQYPPLPGRLCERRINECADPSLNNCSKDADCFDLDRGYRCVCHPGYQDLKPYEEPGRFCYRDPCQDESKNDCWLKRCRVVDIQTGQFACEPCPSGYTDVDTSKPGRNCQTKVPPCQDPTRNDCDRAAYCFGVSGKPDDYTCQCRDGYLDVSSDPVNKAGRKCEIIKNPCFDATKNDCDVNAYCIDLKNNRYNCSCKSGFRDRSPDNTKPGRVCKALVDECAIPQLNNCSAYAICKNKEDGYDCVCKDGYVDKSPSSGLPGRICEPTVDPCSSPTLNQCDMHARCTRVSSSGGTIGDAYVTAPPSGYVCECLPPYRDSGNTTEPGRLCIYDGCNNKLINTCGENADCINGMGYIICKCKEGFYDEDIYRPGTKCVKEQKCGDKYCDRKAGFICDSKTSKCVCSRDDQQPKDGKCIDVVPIDLYLWVVRRNQNVYIFNPDFGNLNSPGTREITSMFVDGVGKVYAGIPLGSSYVSSYVREIQNPANRNPTWDKGLWIEFTAYFDKRNAPDDYAAWQNLVNTIKNRYNYSVGGTELYINEYQLPWACYDNDCHKFANCTETSPTSYTCICFKDYVDLDRTRPGRVCEPQTTIPPTTKPPCGNQVCKAFIGEICVNNRCVCEEGKARKNPNDPCSPYATRIYIPFIVTNFGSKIIDYTPNYNQEGTTEYRELIPSYITNMYKSASTIVLYPNIVAIDVADVRRPDGYGGGKGAFINTSFAVTPNTNKDQLCQQLRKSIQNTRYYLGESQLKLDEKFDFCNPTQQPEVTTPSTIPCGDTVCPISKYCVKGKCSDCPEGQYLKDKKCIDVVIYEMPLWVLRKYETIINFNSSYEDKSSPIYKECIDYLTVGIPSAYAKTPIGEKVIDVVINDLTRPPNNQPGFITHFNVICPKQGAPNISDAYNSLIRSCVDNFNYSVGGTPLYLNQNVAPCTYFDQVPCGKCPNGATDLYPMIPGTNCQTDPCFKVKCDPKAKCVVKAGVAKCECPYYYVEQNGTCIYDFCSDFPECPRLNGTCFNLPEKSDCRCNKSYVDIRALQPNTLKRISCYQNSICMKDIDIDYCCLGLDNCHPSAYCRKLPTGGSQCYCPNTNNIVGDNVACPAVTGRLEEQPCELCGPNGVCVYSAGGEPTCKCNTWYTGEKCQTDVRIILAIIFAIILLLLSLCCLLFVCSRCRCWKKRTYEEMGTSSEGMSAMGAGKESDFYQDFSIPRAKLKEGSTGGFDSTRDRRAMERYLDEERVPGQTEFIDDSRARGYYESDVGSEASYDEQYERRVTTDYKKSQTTKTTTAGAATAEFHVFPPKAGTETEGEYSQIGGRQQRSTSSKRYEEFEEDAISEGGSSVATETSRETVPEESVYDKKTLVKRSHGFEPGPGHANETFRTEISSSTKAKDTKYM